jgi:nitroreductase
VTQSEQQQRLAAAALNQTFVADAPVVIVVCANVARSALGYGNRGEHLYCLQDTAAAIENMLLTAHAAGLAACWVGAFHEDEVAEVINAPRGLRPVAIVPVGHPAEKPHSPTKRSIPEIVHYETF